MLVSGAGVQSRNFSFQMKILPIDLILEIKAQEGKAAEGLE